MARPVIFRFLADADQMDKEMTRVERKLKRTGDKIENVGQKMSVGVTLPLALVGRNAMQAASELEQSTGAIESVFGDAADKIEAFGETAADVAGLSKREVNEMAARIGASLQGLGFDTDESADKVIELEKRAADMAATFGGTTAEAIDAVAAALRGERDPIERYGVSIKQVDVNARTAALGLDTSTAAAKKKSEAIATLDLLLGQTAKTQGQFAREAETDAGKQARLAAEYENQAAVIGQKLLPIKMKLMDAASGLLDQFSELSPEMQNLVVILGGVAAGAGPVLIGVGNMVRGFAELRGMAGKLKGSLSGVGSFLTGPWGVALAGATVGVGLFLHEQQEARRHVAELTDTLDEQTGAVTDNTRAFIVNTLEQAGALQAARKLGVSLELVTDAAMGNADAQRELSSAVDAYVDSLRGGGPDTAAAILQAETLRDVVLGEASAIAEARKQLDRQSEAMGDSKKAAGDLSPELNNLAGNMGDVGKETEETTDALRDQFAAIMAGIDPYFRLFDATGQVTQAQQAYTEAVKEHGKDSKEAEAAVADLAKANLGAEEAVRNLIAEGASLDEITARFQKMRDRGELTADQFDVLIGMLHEMHGLADLRLKVDVQDALRNLARANQAVANLSGSTTTTTRVVPDGVRHAGGPVWSGGTFLVGERGPELFSPTTGGSITPNHELGGGGGSLTIPIYLDGREITTVVVDNIAQAARRGATMVARVEAP